MGTAFAVIDIPRTLADTAYGTLKRDILAAGAGRPLH